MFGFGNGLPLLSFMWLVMYSTTFCGFLPAVLFGIMMYGTREPVSSKRMYPIRNWASSSTSGMISSAPIAPGRAISSILVASPAGGRKTSVNETADISQESQAF
jgi:hypothetical protein